MAELETVIVFSDECGEYFLNITEIDTENIPESLNGESGFHIFHVRVLTELMLRHISKISNKYVFSEEEIDKIACASSLHDIGKSQIPQAILSSENRLSPVEYDIVKKHTDLGKALIESVGCTIDRKTIEYAKDIAMWHHERYDGNGYPDGLKGDDTPIWSQIVSIADAYDALTSCRTYKKAFSQDVAIEMIANGMCGVFNPLIVECLLQVVDNKVLKDIRKNFEKSRAVYANTYDLSKKRILFLGNTRYITKELIDKTFPNSHITIIGESKLQSDLKTRVYFLKKPNYNVIFDTYEFDICVYLSGDLTYGNTTENDIDELRCFLKSIRKTEKNIMFIYFSSLNAAYQDDSDMGFIASAKENLCSYFSEKKDVNIKVVRIPYLYSGDSEDDWLYQMFKSLQYKKELNLDISEDSRALFLSGSDLGELILRLTDNWNEGTGILTVNEEFGITFGELTKKASELAGEGRVYFSGTESFNIRETNNVALRTEYGWFSKISILTDLPDEYEKFKCFEHIGEEPFYKKLRSFIFGNSRLLKFCELFLLFIITEILVNATGSSIYFSVVDFRMAFVVIIAIMNGLNFGLAAASLASVAWVISKMASGTGLITIFYEPTNWLAFIFYFLVGALCGYIKLTKEEKIRFSEEEGSLLEEKLIFTRDLYKDIFAEKQELKKQIIGSKDSFGKIFDIARQLDTMEPSVLSLKIIETFEEVLENRSICVYSINSYGTFGRLEVASKNISYSIPRSIALKDYGPVMKKIENNEVFRNTELAEDLPMYAYSVKRNNKPILLIFIMHTNESQHSLYYVNLFRILCDLVQMSALRAYDYNQAMYDKMHIAGSRILNKDSFDKTVQSFDKMAEKKIFKYLLLEAETGDKTAAEAAELLAGKLRDNDILGEGENGNIRILLSQAGPDDLKFILPRLEATGLSIKASLEECK